MSSPVLLAAVLSSFTAVVLAAPIGHEIQTSPIESVDQTLPDMINDQPDLIATDFDSTNIDFTNIDFDLVDVSM